MSVFSELEERVRERGVRVEERLAILRAVRESEGQEEIRARVEALDARIRAAARKVLGELR